MSSQNRMQFPVIDPSNDPSRNTPRVPYRVRVRIVGVTMALAFVAIIFAAFFGVPSFGKDVSTAAVDQGVPVSVVAPPVTTETKPELTMQRGGATQA